MADREDRLEKKVDKLDERLDKIDVHLAVYNEQLRVHIEGTEQNRRDIAPIKRKMHYAEGAIKFLVLMGVLAALYEAMDLASKHFK